MGFIKKNLIFTVIVVVCILAFVAGAFLAFSESRKISNAKQTIASAQTQLKNMRYADPAPSEENLRASEENLAELVEKLHTLRADLERGGRMSASTDGIGVMASIQQYISDSRRKANEHRDENDVERPVALPQDFGFGFEQYVNVATPLEDPEKNELLDKQRQILSYLLDQLYAAHPESIVAVQREALELGDSSSSKRGKQTFKISPAISARVPDAIDTLAFSLTFTGYTDSLRGFLNRLAEFEMPIVVRSVEVKRPTGQNAVVAPSANKNKNTNIDDIFGALGGGSASESDAPAVAQKPVISEITSTFTVVLEFIEIVLPADAAEDTI
jgi:type II secretory pathway pseudopilin PulG